MSRSLRGEPARPALPAEVFRALGVLCEPPGDGHRPIAAALGLPGAPDPSEYTDLFILHLYPYASVYLGADGMLGGDARDRIAGFWRALRLVPPAEPDHLAALLGLYATLVEREAEETDPARRLLWHEARAALMWEHLASWLPPYLDRLGAVAPPVYRAWGDLLRDAVTAEAALLGFARETPAPALPAHLREAPPLPDPRREGSRAFVAGMLAPVRCGVILTRADLARAARDLGLGLRMGERKFVLAALLSQAPDAVLGWLADDAAACAAEHARHAAVTGGIAAFWADRAAATAALLDELRASAGEAVAAPSPWD